MGKILPIFLKLNFTPNTLGCYGLVDSRTKKITLSKRTDSFSLGVVCDSKEKEKKTKGLTNLSFLECTKAPEVS